MVQKTICLFLGFFAAIFGFLFRSRTTEGRRSEKGEKEKPISVFRTFRSLFERQSVADFFSTSNTIPAQRAIKEFFRIVPISVPNLTHAYPAKKK